MKAAAAKPVKLVASIFTGRPAIFAPTIKRCEERFGPVDFLSEPLAFDFTSYYEREFGAGLARRLVSFERPVAPEELAGAKLFTNRVEEETAGPDGRRRVNVDPGLLSLDKLVLASCKDYSHRIHLKDGVYAEVTLIYTRGAFRPLEWTYPDYGGKTVQSALTAIRTRHAHAAGRGFAAPGAVYREREGARTW